MPSSAVFDKFKSGKLHSGGPNGPVVTNRKQAIAIKISEQKKEKANGGVYPEAKKPKVKKKETKEQRVARAAKIFKGE
jgi:hypothetical protein